MRGMALVRDLSGLGEPLHCFMFGKSACPHFNLVTYGTVVLYSDVFGIQIQGAVNAL